MKYTVTCWGHPEKADMKETVDSLDEAYRISRDYPFVGIAKLEAVSRQAIIESMLGRDITK